MTETVFERMMRWAADRGWKQADVAARLGISPQHITNWKARGIPSDRLVDIARLFGQSIDALVGESEEGVGTPGPWAFRLIDEQKLRALPPEDAARLEGVILLGAAQLGLDVRR